MRIEINNMDLHEIDTIIKFAKVKDNAIIPSKDDENAGYDIYACFNEDFIIIEPHETKMIPTGIASSCSPEYYFQLLERGSTGTKGIAQRCGVIDSGYRNEWFVPITNTTNKTLVISKPSEKEMLDGIKLFQENCIIYPYTKAICQAVLLPVPRTIVEEVSYEELKAIKSERGDGKLGSTGK